MKRIIFYLSLVCGLSAYAGGPVTPPGIQVEGTPSDNNVLVYTNGFLVDSGVAPTNLVAVSNQLTEAEASALYYTKTEIDNAAINTNDLISASAGSNDNVSVYSDGVTTYFSTLNEASEFLGAGLPPGASNFTVRLLRSHTVDSDVSFYGSNYTLDGGGNLLHVDRYDVGNGEGAAITVRGTDINVNDFNLITTLNDGYPTNYHGYGFVYSSVFNGTSITFPSDNVDFYNCNVSLIDKRTSHASNTSFATMVGSDAQNCSINGGTIGAYEANSNAIVKGHFYSYHGNSTATHTNGTVFNNVQIYVSQHTDTTAINISSVPSGQTYLFPDHFINCSFNRKVINWWDGDGTVQKFYEVPVRNQLNEYKVKALCLLDTAELFSSADIDIVTALESRIYYPQEFSGSSGAITLTSSYNFGAGANGFRWYGLQCASNANYQALVSLNSKDFGYRKNLRARILYLTVGATTTAENFNLKAWHDFPSDFTTVGTTDTVNFGSVSIGTGTDTSLEWGEWRDITPNAANLPFEWAGYLTFSSTQAANNKFLVMAIEVEGRN